MKLSLPSPSLPCFLLSLFIFTFSLLHRSSPSPLLQPFLLLPPPSPSPAISNSLSFSSLSCSLSFSLACSLSSSLSFPIPFPSSVYNIL